MGWGVTAAWPGQFAQIIISAVGTATTRLGGTGEHTILGQKCVNPSSLPACTNPLYTHVRATSKGSKLADSIGRRPAAGRPLPVSREQAMRGVRLW